MINWQEILLFLVRDNEARKQFLITCLVTLAGFVIPILPMLVVVGYCAKIMRPILQERKAPTMPEWQTSDWSHMFMDGLRLWGAQLLLVSPLLILMCCGMAFLFLGSAGLPLLAENNSESTALIMVILMVIGIGFTMLFSLLSFPYGILISAALPHAVINDSFAAAFAFKDWFPIFRKALGQFILGYLLIMAVSFLFMFVIQIAMATIILMCIVPFVMIPYSAYFSLVSYAIYAEAYRNGLDVLQSEQNATA